MKKTTKKMAKGGSIGSLTKISKAVAPVAKAVQKAAPAPIQKAAPAPTKKSDLAQKAAPVANAAINALSRMRFNAGGMAMVEKDGKKVPAFAADGKGKMAKGGMAKGKC